MKKQFKHLVLYFPLLITLSAFSGNTQNQSTHIASKNNRSCNGNCTMLDIPQLNNNPKAILFVTVKDKSVNPHPFGAYYFKGKWNIMNLDQAAMPDGAKFTVEYFINPDPDHFQYLIKKENLQQKDASAFIDHPALNNHKDAQFSVFHSWVPEAKEYGNREEVKLQYDDQAGKWTLSNITNSSLMANIAYNINITSAGNATTKPVNTTPANTTPVNTTTVNTTPVNTTPVNTNPTNTIATGNSVTGPAILFYMTVWANGIKLPGECLKPGRLDQVELVDFIFETNAAREAATGRSSARHAFEPIVIRKYNGGPATIPYFNSFVKNDDLVVTIDVYSTGLSSNTATLGVVGLNYTIKLSAATFVGYKQTWEDLGDGRGRGNMDIIKIGFNKIEFIKDGVTVVDPVN